MHCISSDIILNKVILMVGIDKFLSLAKHKKALK